ncbi:hypothetical protein FHT77_001762 [Rhizobium sp. BK181]|nr:hypothetical protein [Rhizobium sp. BK181]
MATSRLLPSDLSCVISCWIGLHRSVKARPAAGSGAHCVGINGRAAPDIFVYSNKSKSVLDLLFG